MISIIVAAAKNGVIGKQGGLPWNLPAELANFKKITIGHPMIMGQATHEAIGRTLPGRTNIVLSRDKDYPAAEGSLVATSLQEAFDIAKNSAGGEETFVIGGENVFDQAMPYADRMYLTKIDAEVEGDKYFKYSPAEWVQNSGQKHAADDKNNYAYEFTIQDRK